MKGDFFSARGRREDRRNAAIRGLSPWNLIGIKHYALLHGGLDPFA